MASNPEFMSGAMLPLTDDMIAAIRNARKARGWSQSKLAAETGLHQQHIAKVEMGKVRWSRSIGKILVALQLQPPAEIKPVASDTGMSRLRATALGYVRDHGRRQGPLDALLLPDDQDPVVAAAMRLVEAIDGAR